MELTHYLVEVDRPPDGWAGLQEAAANARAIAAELRAAGQPVRFLRSIFVPEDDICFFLYEAPSREAVREAAERAAVAVARVDEADTLHVNPRVKGGGDESTT